MLNSNAKLNKKVLGTDVEQVPIRDGYGEGLLVVGEKDMNVVALSADLTESTRTEAFAKKFPERYVECGVAEQNMVTVAAGLAVAGKIPFVASYATFSPGRNWEQIRTTICYNDANVKIAGHHAGLMTGPDGATHQATEDIALMRALPNMKVIVPCDAIEARKATVAAGKLWGPVYLRFAREKTPIITTDKTPFTPGKAEVFWEAKKPACVIFACGTMVAPSLRAAEALEKEKIGVTVVNVHTIKPLDELAVVTYAERAGAVVTAEEHQIAGGLGGAIAEVLARKRPTPIEFVGIHDMFGESGKPQELMDKYGLGVKDIIAAVKRAVKRG
jgi:transketolase